MTEASPKGKLHVQDVIKVIESSKYLPFYKEVIQKLQKGNIVLDNGTFQNQLVSILNLSNESLLKISDGDKRFVSHFLRGTRDLIYWTLKQNSEYTCPETELWRILGQIQNGHITDNFIFNTWSSDLLFCGAVTTNGYTILSKEDINILSNDETRLNKKGDNRTFQGQRGGKILMSLGNHDGHILSKIWRYLTYCQQTESTYLEAR